MSLLLKILSIIFLAITLYILANYFVAVFVRVKSRISLSSNKLCLNDVLQDKKLLLILLLAASLILSFSFSPYVLPFLLAISFIMSKKIPNLLIKQKQKKLMLECENSLDSCSDIIAMGISSGLSFDSALAMYCSKFDGALSLALSNAQFKWNNGICSRQKALEDLTQNIKSSEIERFCNTVIHAIKHGAPIADMLKNFADDIRSKKTASIEKKIEKAPVKMLIPMCCCILPAMLIFVVGPVVIQFVYSGV
ncbi:MAG: type II secretion system F family protein [Coriobacteriales bacterium]|nr:type II secretion system F family protein [Coriobacteriales bacterium]